MHLPEIKITISFKGKKSELIQLTSSSDVVEVVRELMSKDGLIHYREEMILLCLNQANMVIGYHRLSSGGLTGTVADLRIIATLALNCTANQIILAHNHPSGNTRPSEADKQLTSKAKDGLALLDIKLLDHLIITDQSYYSFAEEGYL